MDIICGIYCITNTINQKKYVGLSKHIYRRWEDHKRIAFNPNNKKYHLPLYCAIRKYGLENFSFEIIEVCSEELLKERECYWIKFYNTVNTGYNLTEGGDFSCNKDEKHPKAKLTREDVIFCRKEYAKGTRSKEIYDQYYSNIMTYGGFQAMWHGTTWKDIMPEVFENKQHKRQKITEEDILDIRTKFFEGMPIQEIDKIYKDKYSHSTISRTINKKDFYPELWPTTEDHHVRLNRKVTPEDVRLVRKLKAEGYLHKDIREALNNRISMTTISDIVTGKRYNDIE